LRLQAIEAQPVSGQISHQRGKVRPGDEQHAEEKTWRMPVTLHKISASSGVEKNPLAKGKRRRIIRGEP